MAYWRIPRRYEVAIAAGIAMVVVVFFASLILGVSGYLARWIHGDSSIHQELNSELSKSPDPANAVKVDYVDSFKGTSGAAANSYKTTMTDNEIRAYYDQEMQRRGWKLYGESKLTSWDKDLGESQRIYCKQPLAADIYFTGQNEAEFGYTYSLSISWRVVDECPS